jgi:hypothetical protein
VLLSADLLDDLLGAAGKEVAGFLASGNFLYRFAGSLLE